LVARGGTPKGTADKGANDAIALLTVLGSERPKTVTVNEFTTVASVWTGAQFLEGDVLSGPQLGLRIAAGNVPNFVDLSTGGDGTTTPDGVDNGQTPPMAKFATLATMLGRALAPGQTDRPPPVPAAGAPPTGGG